ncbi:hypothetical protein RQP46_007474 [Phenoliferia psychrophenolica]
MQGILCGPVTENDIDVFLKEHKPSQNKTENGTGGWYWVKSGKEPFDDVEDKGSSGYPALIEDGVKLERALTAECERIKAEEPVRENKKLGKQSQKQWREKAYALFNQGVGTVARKHGVLSGKWLYFPSVEYVDGLWSTIVRAIASKDGALAKFGRVPTAKVSTSATERGYVICVYVDDSWDKDAVEGALKILANDLKLTPLSYKCDANTLLGIDSNHPSKIPSSLWKVSDFLDLAKLKEEAQAKADSKAKAAPKKTAEEEVDDFDAVESEDDEPVKKKPKKK